MFLTKATGQTAPPPTCFVITHVSGVGWPENQAWNEVGGISSECMAALFYKQSVHCLVVMLDKTFICVNLSNYLIYVYLHLKIHIYISPWLHLFDQKYGKNNKNKIVKYSIITINNNSFLFEYILIYRPIYKIVFSVTRSFRNHFNMLICSSRNINISKSQKQLCCLIFVRKPWLLFFIKVKKTAFFILWNYYYYCYFIYLMCLC